MSQDAKKPTDAPDALDAKKPTPEVAAPTTIAEAQAAPALGDGDAAARALLNADLPPGYTRGDQGGDPSAAVGTSGAAANVGVSGATVPSPAGNEQPAPPAAADDGKA